MKKLVLKTTLLISFIVTNLFVTSIYAEGSHKHSHKSEHGDAHWESPKEDAARINPVKSDGESIARGAKTYAESCASCHGESAQGDGMLAASLNPKPTNLKEMSGGHTDGDFAWKIANGRGAMPAWKDALSDNNIWDLVNFIQNLKNEGSSSDSDHSEHKHDNHKH